MKKFIKEWGVIAGIFLVLYFTGLHTEVAAFAQRMILHTGLITPDTSLDSEMNEVMDYNFELKTLEGQLVKMEELKGKVIFLNIWATWCAPCVAEMPNIQALYEKVKSEDIAFVMLSVDKSGEKAKKFIDKKGFTFPVYQAASEMPELFRVPSIPTTFVIDKTGKVASKNVGMANYNKKSFINFLNNLNKK